MRKARFAKQFIFWLNLEDSQEYAIAETIEDLKAERNFSKSIRDGIRLIVDLSQGRTNVLKELFPSILEDIKGSNSSTSGNNDPTSSKSEIDALQAKIDALTQAVLSQQVPEHLNKARSLANAQHTTPELILNDLPLLQSKQAKVNGQSRANLLNSMSAMAGTKKITIKPESPIKTIAGSDVKLSTPTFDSLEI